ncbi:MAG: DUF3772 domain-containing protein [Pseudorhodobacter sp.]
MTRCGRTETGWRGAVLAVLAAGLLALAAGSASAQANFSTGPGPNETATTSHHALDFEEWQALATDTEALIDVPDVSAIRLEQRRAELVVWREKFLSAQGANSSRISTLRNQIEALGPPPAEGETETEEIATRRVDLSEQLSRLQAPAISAVEAYSRADGLVREIDRLLREQQAEALLRLSPSPVNPVNWPAAVTAFTANSGKLMEELRRNWRNPAQRQQLIDSLPVVIGLLVIAALAILRGRDWIERFALRLQTRASSRGREVWVFLASLGQIIVPMIGVVAVATAFILSGMAGPVGTVLAQSLSGIGFSIFAAFWLAGRLFPAQEDGDAPLKLTTAERARGRFNTDLIGIALALETVRRVVLPEAAMPEAAASVLAFPTVLVICVALFRIGGLMVSHEKAVQAGEEGESRGSYDRLVGFIGKGTVVVALLAPLLGAAGYVAAATALVFPAAMSLALIAVLTILQRLVGDIWTLLSRSAEDGGRDALVPVLISFMLVLASLPVFALIWGARTSELSEIFSRLREGFVIGQTRISPSDFIVLGLVFGAGYLATRLLQGALRTSILPKTSMDQGGKTAIVAGVGYLGISLAALVSITTAGIDLSALAIVAGALSVGLGFGLQNIVSNFVSGIILLIERPISEGDWIEVGGVMGTVQSISVRSTRIQTFDRTDVIVPNTDLIAGQVTNWTRFNLTGRLIVKVGVAYGSDTRKVEAILREIAEAQPLAVLNPPPAVLLIGFGADSLDFEIRMILRDVNFGMGVRSEINHEIARRFAEEGIEIPFGQRDIWLRNPEALRAALAGPPTALSSGQSGEDTDGTGNQGARSEGSISAGAISGRRGIGPGGPGSCQGKGPDRVSMLDDDPADAVDASADGLPDDAPDTGGRSA